MRMKSGTMGWGKGAGANRTKNQIILSHKRATIKDEHAKRRKRPGLKLHVHTKAGTGLGDLSGLNVRGFAG